jgi:predicted nucleotidyltransferase
MLAEMNRAQAIATILAHEAELGAFGVKSLGLFGSFARDEAGPGSDVDILVDFDGITSFDGYMDVKDLLERRVDLVTPRALKPSVRSYVERDLIRVA